jgi:hypothetical protein
MVDHPQPVVFDHQYSLKKNLVVRQYYLYHFDYLPVQVHVKHH